jgi:hypothetical protein
VKALRWLMMKHAPLILRPKPDMAMLRWLGQMLGQCNARDYAINKSRMVRLAEFSRDRLIELRQDFGIAYDERSQGTCSCSARKAARWDSQGYCRAGAGRRAFRGARPGGLHRGGTWTGGQFFPHRGRPASAQ